LRFKIDSKLSKTTLLWKTKIHKSEKGGWGGVRKGSAKAIPWNLRSLKHQLDYNLNWLKFQQNPRILRKLGCYERGFYKQGEKNQKSKNLKEKR